jgi:hypothetical protein
LYKLKRQSQALAAKRNILTHRHGIAKFPPLYQKSWPTYFDHHAELASKFAHADEEIEFLKRQVTFGWEGVAHCFALCRWRIEYIDKAGPN